MLGKEGAAFHEKNIFPTLKHGCGLCCNHWWSKERILHTLKSTMDYLKNPEVNLQETELCRPDLKRAVKAKWPKNIAELEDFCKEEWEK